MNYSGWVQIAFEDSLSAAKDKVFDFNAVKNQFKLLTWAELQLFWILFKSSLNLFKSLAY